MELLFGGMQDVARFVVAFMLVLGLIGAGALLWRRFGAGPLSLAKLVNPARQAIWNAASSACACGTSRGRRRSRFGVHGPVSP